MKKNGSMHRTMFKFLPRAAVIVGLPESPIRNLKLINVHLSGTLGATMQYADVMAKDFTVKAEQGESIQIGAGVIGSLK
jgi:hypothetical protein